LMLCAFFCVCVVMCLGRGLSTSWSPVQAVLPSVNNQETEQSALCSKVGAKRRKKRKQWYLMAFVLTTAANLQTIPAVSLQPFNG
jgi:hypothetical protein